MRCILKHKCLSWGLLCTEENYVLVFQLLTLVLLHQKIHIHHNKKNNKDRTIDSFQLCVVLIQSSVSVH